MRIGDTGGPLILLDLVAQSATTDDRDARRRVFSRQIELVQGDRRQVLGALGLPTDAGAIGAPPDGLLRWAGDLDRDGRPDLLLVAMDADAAVFMLFLSSLATPDEFVGEAGVVLVRPDVPLTRARPLRPAARDARTIRPHRAVGRMTCGSHRALHLRSLGGRNDGHAAREKRPRT